MPTNGSITDSDGFRYGPVATDSPKPAEFFGAALDQLIAGMEHQLLDTQPNRYGWATARCTCGYVTLGFADYDTAIAALENAHIRRSQ